MIQLLLCEATAFQHRIPGYVGETIHEDAERLTAGMGVDDERSGEPLIGWAPSVSSTEVHGAAAYDEGPVPSVHDIASALASRTNPEATPDWDPVGLQLGDPDGTVDRVAVCHEVTERVVERLEESPVDLLVSYHPLLFTPTTRVLAGRSAGARSYRLIRAGVSLLVTHTDFDAAPGGTADALAGFFDLREIREFGSDPETGLPAIGRIGSFDGTLGTVDAMIADQFGSNGVRITGDPETQVEALAVVPGSGAAFVEAAAEVADALVTGDVSHHRTVAAADLGLAVVDPGHTATERPGMKALAGLVGEVAGVEMVDLTDIDPRTWR